MVTCQTTPEDILGFWFAGPADDAGHIAERIEVWFKVDAAFDATVREQFSDVLERAIAGHFDHWPATARGALALIVMLDQFPRNIYRNTPRAFASDARALAVTRDGIARGIDVELALFERVFFYIPFEHAEDLEAQDRCVHHYRQLLETADPAFHEIAAFCVEAGKAHREVIRRFGRFPHRNPILDREPAREEIEWLKMNADGWGQRASEAT